MKQLLFVLFVWCWSGPLMAQQQEPVIHLQPWTFNTGADPAWLQPDFNDSHWRLMPVPAHWEEEGLPDYDGYACYRTRAVIPSSMRRPSALGLRFEMGAIDDFDSVFVNGHCIGASTEFREDRVYVVLYDEGIIRWDQENVVAVKVLDKYGWGGMYRGQPSIKNAGLDEFVHIDRNLNYWDFGKDGQLSKSISINAKRPVLIEGSLNITLVDPVNGKRKQLLSRAVRFSKEKPAVMPFVLQLPAQRSFQLQYTFRSKQGKATLTTGETPPYLLTPVASEKPVINGPARYGVRPGSPVLYRIPITGVRPMRIEALQLPEGLTLDTGTGIISGRIRQEGSYEVLLKAGNAAGRTERRFQFVVGQQQALTPPLGWNSWNAWGIRVDDQKIRAAANALVGEGLADYGWQYINIDDGWQHPQRAADSSIRSNERFPDMKALADHIHGLGLKFGLYSSPGPATCAGFTGSYKNEALDAAAWAAWGVDLVKYDLCSYQHLVPDRERIHMQAPYDLMGRCLAQQPRDILYSLCQYGWGKVWEWGEAVGGQLWRTGDDIEDTWSSVSSIGFEQEDKRPYAGPGHWNDPDMLVVGTVGWGYPRPSRLTPDEQYTHVGLWSLLAAPLLIGCDLQDINPFTRNLLCNSEVLAINQDPLGLQASRIYQVDSIQVYSKKMSDGSYDIGIINGTSQYRAITATAAMLGMKGGFTMRDCWRQRDLGSYRGPWKLGLPAHGMLLLRCQPL
ncbi:MAG: putative Ig domain-containing protein [Candidatus Pseudobacter hemicellulosilyticus]|uniref:Alpha-galactosidase n=1 Tax=Candidatus Pseudobacter hemicellulosilyticus TaxID=3121375 RepID=A0AAJ6BJY4_9BACT|nr:MAG: putative Ig domain-containing protein [Pseudobacter sp.]